MILMINLIISCVFVNFYKHGHIKNYSMNRINSPGKIIMGNKNENNYIT